MNHSVDVNGWNVGFGKKATQELAYLAVSCVQSYRGVSFFDSTDNLVVLTVLRSAATMMHALV